MSKTTRFIVEIVTADDIVDDNEKIDMALNIARAIVNEANNGMGITPVFSINRTNTEIVYVREWYSDKQIIEHVS
jgi:hypothetical protein